MPENDIKRCQVERFAGEGVCGRELYDGEYCICHSKDPNKDMEKFNAEVEKELNRDDHYDFTRFVFPATFQFKNNKFERRVFFNNAHFLGDAVFGGATFSAEAGFFAAAFSGEAAFYRAAFSKAAIFYQAIFSGKTDFRQAKFLGDAEFTLAIFSSEADFWGSSFSGFASFIEAVFSGEASFYQATFSGNASFREAIFSGEAHFYEATFSSEANFSDATFSDGTAFDQCILKEEATVIFEQSTKDVEGFESEVSFGRIDSRRGARIIFRHMDLRECSFLMTDVTGFEFIDVTWPKVRGRTRIFKRNGVYDEIAPESDENPQYDLLAQLYRRLQANYINNYRFSEASDFYIGEQEMMRKTKGRIRQYLSVNMAYKLISHYGENYWMPLIYIGLVLLIFPMIFLMTGIDLSSHIDKAAGNPDIVNYDFGSTVQGWSFVSDYAKTFSLNFGYVTFNRSEMAGRLHEWYLTLLINIEVLKIVVLVSFFVLALRRKFKRKSF